VIGGLGGLDGGNYRLTVEAGGGLAEQVEDAPPNARADRFGHPPEATDRGDWPQAAIGRCSVADPRARANRR